MSIHTILNSNFCRYLCYSLVLLIISLGGLALLVFGIVCVVDGKIDPFCHHLDKISSSAMISVGIFLILLIIGNIVFFTCRRRRRGDLEYV